MTDADEKGPSPSMGPQSELEKIVESASDKARDLFEKVCADLRTAAEPPEPRMFFPHGIELIHVRIGAKATDRIQFCVDVKVAGAAAPNENALVVEAGVDELCAEQ